jgi:2',3'-cyclic-nucleotide 2'-phosphodiesterase (5'-nucleotidase family)
MANLKKYNGVLKLFVIFLTLFLLASCSKHSYFITKEKGSQIPINENVSLVTSSAIQTGLPNQIESYIKPFREHINKDLDSVLSYCPETLDKSVGLWQSTIGNLLAEVTLKKANVVFLKREKKNIDLCILNHGGIRSSLAKGNVTTRTAFEIMPFENTSIVVALKGEQILEMVDYIIATKKAQPIYGITFTIDKNNSAKNILIQGKPVDKEMTYYVVTNDYLANGGDNMNFFKKGIKTYDLDYKLRNILIDYFKEVDTIPILKDVRINVE